MAALAGSRRGGRGGRSSTSEVSAYHLTCNPNAAGSAEGCDHTLLADLFAGIDYQPLNLGETVALLAFYTADEVDGTYVNPRELVVLDSVPNDISVVSGIITGTFQTPLSADGRELSGPRAGRKPRHLRGPPNGIPAAQSSVHGPVEPSLLRFVRLVEPGPVRGHRDRCLTCLVVVATRGFP